MRRLEEEAEVAAAALRAAETEQRAAERAVELQQHRYIALDAAWDAVKALLELLCRDNTVVKDRFVKAVRAVTHFCLRLSPVCL